MTRKKFWRMRNALTVKLSEWSKTAGLGKASGVSNKAERPVSGKPLVDFKFGRAHGYGTSYKECWESESLKALRKSLGM